MVTNVLKNRFEKEKLVENTKKCLQFHKMKKISRLPQDGITYDVPHPLAIVNRFNTRVNSKSTPVDMP